MKLLKQAELGYNEIITVYRDILSQDILDIAKKSMEKSIPRHLKNFVSTLNMVDKDRIIPEPTNFEECVSVFSNENIDFLIEKAYLDNNVVAVGGVQNQISAKDILKHCYDSVASNVSLIEQQLFFAKNKQTII